MKQLPVPELFQYDKNKYFELSGKSLDMVMSPTRSKGYEVILIRDVACYKKGQKGIVRDFNQCDLKKIHNDYNWALQYKMSWPLPDLNAVYDFHPLVKRDGRIEVSTWHAHISRFDFKPIQPKQTQLNFEL
jgi:hypothetical protein